MACPVNHCIPTGAILPSIKLVPDLQNYENNILLQDFYSKYYRRYGVLRDEMMIVMPSVMMTDVLTGLDNLDYIEDN
jgi:hypothetical protein